MNNEQLSRFSPALERLAGDKELLVAMASMVVDDATETVNELQDQLDHHALANAASQAHKLKGMCSTFETGSPVVELEEVIAAARSGQGEEAREMFQRCKPQIRKLIADIAQLLY